METINNITSAATKAVWGSPESKEEPINGVKGNTAEGQPYDAGNMDPDQAVGLPTPGQEKATSNLDSAALTSGFDPTTNTANLSSATGTTTQPSTTSSSTKNADTSNPAAIGKPELRDTSNAAEHASKPVAADSSTGGQHDTSDPKDRPEENPVPEADLKKPGPKPLDVVAKEHGGDAGNIGKDGKSTTAGDATAGTESEDGPQTVSHGEGTGEKVVHATGFAAEGGDFDAANPGAGREADRLAEEHGGPVAGGDSHNKHHGHSPTKHTSNASTGSEEKKSLKERIKAKLHKH